MFISLEGIDGCGKTTQTQLFEGYKLNGNMFLTTREPTYGFIGKVIKKLLKEENIDGKEIQLLFAADRAYHINTFIKPQIKKFNVISDRYIMSSLAYGMASKLDIDWLESINSKFIQPDLYIIIDIDTKTAINRLGERKNTDSFEKLEFLEDVKKAYKFLAGNYSNCFIVDGNKSVSEVHNSILKIIQEHNNI